MSEDMLRLFQMMKVELEKQTATITQNISDALMLSIEEKIQPIIEENKLLKSEVDILNKKIKYLDNMNKKNNIILHGVKEKENSYEGLLNIIKDILLTLNVKIENNEINKYYRLGKKQEGNKDRPILICFTSYHKKVEILKNKRKTPQKIYITEDFSKETLEMRRNLKQQLKEERDKGNEAFIKNNKVIVKGRSEAEKRKREVSTSPKCIHTPPHPSEGKNIIIPSKLHKADAFAYMRARSYSLSEKQSQQSKA